MTIQECYQRLGGDFEQVQKRLPSVSLVKRFITKFLDDGSFSELCRAMESAQPTEAFRAAHTLKGVCANLGFDRLGASASKMTELLRPEGSGVPEEAVLILGEVSYEYRVTVSAIRACLDL